MRLVAHLFVLAAYAVTCAVSAILAPPTQRQFTVVDRPPPPTPTVASAWHNQKHCSYCGSQRGTELNCANCGAS